MKPSHYTSTGIANIEARRYSLVTVTLPTCLKAWQDTYHAIDALQGVYGVDKDGDKVSVTVMDRGISRGHVISGKYTDILSTPIEILPLRINEETLDQYAKDTLKEVLAGKKDPWTHSQEMVDRYIRVERRLMRVNRLIGLYNEVIHSYACAAYWETSPHPEPQLIRFKINDRVYIISTGEYRYGTGKIILYPETPYTEIDSTLDLSHKFH